MLPSKNFPRSSMSDTPDRRCYCQRSDDTLVSQFLLHCEKLLNANKRMTKHTSGGIAICSQTYFW